jgi:hypothetical protein
MTLTTALALFGAVVLLALVAHSLWTLKRASPRQALRDDRPADGAAPAERVEPAMGALDEAGGGVGGDTVPQEPQPEPPALRVLAARRTARLDALIDALVPLALEAPISGDFVLAHVPPTRRAGSKPFYVEGLDAETGEWEIPAAGRRYGELQAGVQMASRSGALNEIEYSEFVQKVQAFAEAVGAMPDFPDMLDVVARARELDALASPLDAQITVTLRSKGAAWSVGYIQQNAARHGLVAGPLPGRLVLPAVDDGAPAQLVLAIDAQAALADDAQAAAVRAFTLSLDVPQTAERAEPFPTWHRIATALAEEMDASIVDDQGRTVTLHAFAAIGQDLIQLYSQLEALDLAAGSAAARRLFS